MNKSHIPVTCLAVRNKSPTSDVKKFFLSYLRICNILDSAKKLELKLSAELKNYNWAKRTNRLINRSTKSGLMMRKSHAVEP